MPTLELAGWKASYQESGVGLPIVLIPGITEYKESFQYQIRGLSDRYHVIAYDVRPASREENYSVELLSEDLAAFMDTLRLPSAVIAGHSFGGLIAQEFAREHPDRAKAVVLMSTFAKAPEHSHAKLLRYMSSGALDDPETAVAILAHRLGLSKPKEREPDDYLAWVMKQAAKTSPATVNARIKVINQFDSRPWLEHLVMPLLLLVGQDDRPPFLSAAQFVQRSTPDSVLDVVDHTQHFPHIQRHDLLNASIDDFIGSRLTSLVD